MYLTPTRKMRFLIYIEQKNPGYYWNDQSKRFMLNFEGIFEECSSFEIEGFIFNYLSEKSLTDTRKEMLKYREFLKEKYIFKEGKVYSKPDLETLTKKYPFPHRVSIDIIEIIDEIKSAGFNKEFIQYFKKTLRDYHISLISHNYL